MASDTADDDYPIVRFTPPRSGKYRIDVKMVSCAEDYCYFGLGVFEYP